MTMKTQSLGDLCTLIKDTINIVDFCEQTYNAVFIPGQHGWFNTLCLMPEHPETNPSMGVNIETNTFHCFSCGQKGSIIDMVMTIENMDLTQAVSFLLDFLDIQPDISSPKFHAIKKLLKSSTPRIHRDILLDAKIKQIKKQKDELEIKKYYKLVCDIFEGYSKMGDSEFQKFIFKV